jgi:excisionase family DNA binding protein
MSDFLSHIKDVPPHEPPSREELILRVEYMERKIRQLVQRVTELEEKQQQLNTLKQRVENHLDTLTTEQVIRLLKISPRTLFNYRKAGKLTGSFVGGKYLYEKEDIDRFLQKR